MNSDWFGIYTAFGGLLETLAADLSVGWLSNPALPIDIESTGKDRALFLISRGDRLNDQKGQQPEMRTVRVVFGAVALTADALRDADALHFAARDRLKSTALRQALITAGLKCSRIAEVEIEPELKDLVTRGSALMSAYEIDYFQSFPSFA